MNETKKSRLGAKLFIFGIILSVVIIVLFFSLSRSLEKPKSCLFCHYMSPFYKKWETSTHNMVSCLKCHDYGLLKSMVSQAKFLAGSYNPRPRTEVADSKCLQKGCHEARLKDFKVAFKRGITFNHKTHFTELRRGIKLHCSSCHFDIVQGTHMAVSQDICFLCHFMGARPGEAFTGCPSCHEAPATMVEFGGKHFLHTSPQIKGLPCSRCHIEVISGNGSVPEERCYFCHVDRGERYKDIAFVHTNHVTKRTIDCLECHTRIRHGKVKVVYNP